MAPICGCPIKSMAATASAAAINSKASSMVRVSVVIAALPTSAYVQQTCHVIPHPIENARRDGPPRAWSLLQVGLEELLKFVERDLVQLVVQINVISVLDYHKFFRFLGRSVGRFAEVAGVSLFTVDQE